MLKVLLELVHVGPVLFIITLISTVNLTKLAIGSILLLAGAFFKDRGKSDGAGEAEIKAFGTAINVKGATRFVVAAAGLVIIVLSFLP